MAQTDDQTTILVKCAANDHVLALRLDADEWLVYLSLYIDEFYAHQRSFLSRWVERFKMAFTIMMGREYQFEDIILEMEDAQLVLDFLLEVDTLLFEKEEEEEEDARLLEEWKYGTPV